MAWGSSSWAFPVHAAVGQPLGAAVGDIMRPGRVRPDQSDGLGESETDGRCSARSVKGALSPALGASSDGFAANAAELVAVRVANIGAIIIGMIMRPQTRLALVAAARGQGGRMKTVDREAIIGRKSDHRSITGSGGLAIEWPADTDKLRPGLIVKAAIARSLCDMRDPRSP